MEINNKEDSAKMPVSDCNSVEYWNERFTNGSWSFYKGEEQSQFFARIAVEALPDRIRKMMEANTGTLIDYGCAEGAGTAYISAHFPSLSITGVDFSEAAVQKAGKRYPQCSFETGDITAELKKADIVFSSNTLEHLKNPRAVLENLVASARKAAIILLPFEDESGIKEHFSVFHADFFPVKIGGNSMIYFKIIDCRDIPNTCWPGKQILIIYAPATEETGLSMSELYHEWVARLIDQSYLQRQELAQERERYAAELTQEREKHVAELTQEREKHAAELRKTEENCEQEHIELKKYENNISTFSSKKYTETFMALSFVDRISHSKPYRMAHFIVEIVHAFFGSEEDRTLGKKYLFRDRKTITRFNYMEELRSIVRKLGDTSSINQPNSDDQDLNSGKIIRKILQEYPGKDVFVMPVLIDWNVPLFQRPQQIAMGLAHNGALFIYLSGNYCDHVDEPVFLEDNLVLAKNELLPLILQIANEENKRVIIDMYSTGNAYDADWVKQWDHYQYSVLYEYVDEISEEISGIQIPESSLRRHRNFLKDTNIYMVATAEKLYNEVVAARGTKNVLFSGNGVDLKHFQQEIDWTQIPKSIRRILESGCPIIGYYGAIAVWFDYDLIYQAATERPDYVFLMIGPQYGDPEKTKEKVRRCSKLKNVFFTGTVDYKILPHVANNFTVATIPFLINDITESTSPIKLYEYMAMGKLTVTTAMRECMKHPEVMIAHNADEYIELLDKAVSISKGSEYPTWRERLLKVAKANSWDEKAKEIIELVSADER